MIADEIMRRSLTIRASNRVRRSVGIALRRHHACVVDDDPFNPFAGVAATPFFDASVTPPHQTVRYVDDRTFHYYRSIFIHHCYQWLLLKSHQTRCGGISQRKKHLLEQNVSCSVYISVVSTSTMFSHDRQPLVIRPLGRKALSAHLRSVSAWTPNSRQALRLGTYIRLSA